MAKKYVIRKLGVHDGYYKADPSLAKKMVGMEVIPVGKIDYREDDETKVISKGKEPVVLFFGGTYHGDFEIPELHVVRTHLSEAYLKIMDESGKVEDDAIEQKNDALGAIESEIERLSKLLEEIKAHKGSTNTHSAIAEVAATLIATDSKGTMVVEDDSKLPKSAVKPGFYKVDENGEPDPSRPAEEEPGFAPVSDEEKQAKFDRAAEVAEEKRLAREETSKGKKGKK